MYVFTLLFRLQVCTFSKTRPPFVAQRVESLVTSPWTIFLSWVIIQSFNSVHWLPNHVVNFLLCEWFRLVYDQLREAESVGYEDGIRESICKSDQERQLQEQHSARCQLYETPLSRPIQNARQRCRCTFYLLDASQKTAKISCFAEEPNTIGNSWIMKPCKTVSFSNFLLNVHLYFNSPKSFQWNRSGALCSAFLLHWTIPILLLIIHRAVLLIFLTLWSFRETVFLSAN